MLFLRRRGITLDQFSRLAPDNAISTTRRHARLTIRTTKIVPVPRRGNQIIASTSGLYDIWDERSLSSQSNNYRSSMLAAWFPDEDEDATSLKCMRRTYFCLIHTQAALLF